VYLFHKYQGTGNDFVMIDDREELFPVDDLDLVRKICNRRFGIGADGLILIRLHPSADFEMIYFNSDGSQSLCGNGSRCALKFANYLDIIDSSATFQAIDGLHTGFIKDNLIHIHMGDVHNVDRLESSALFINTGSPHHIEFVDDLDNLNVLKEGARIRYSDSYRQDGTNVNFVKILDHESVHVRTYERGVEGETLSCGTGVTAVSLAMGLNGYKSPVSVLTPGGSLKVSFEFTEDQRFTNIYLIGPAEFVFQGTF